MKKTRSITLILLIGLCSLSTATVRAETNAEEIATAVLRDAIALVPRVGTSTNQLFLREFDVHLYQSALNSTDKKLKALLAIQALRQRPMMLKPGQMPPSAAERMKSLEQDSRYQVLVKWYFDLISQRDEKR